MDIWGLDLHRLGYQFFSSMSIPRERRGLERMGGRRFTKGWAQTGLYLSLAQFYLGKVLSALATVPLISRFLETCFSFPFLSLQIIVTVKEIF
jgi:hypothetical protein